jgi:hypothetical protein
MLGLVEHVIAILKRPGLLEHEIGNREEAAGLVEHVIGNLEEAAGLVEHVGNLEESAGLVEHVIDIIGEAMLSGSCDWQS